MLKDHSADADNKPSVVANIERNGSSIDGSSKYIDSNLNTLTKFKKTLLAEQKSGEENLLPPRTGHLVRVERSS